MKPGNYQQYFDEYNEYSLKNNIGQKYIELASIITPSKYYRLIDYSQYNKSNKDKKIFLVVPSIFNSPEILFLSTGKSFIENLLEHGDVILVDWLEVGEPDYSLNDYVARLVEILRDLEKKYALPINLIGHCIGGNIAAAAIIISADSLINRISSLTLLTTPWNFDHFIDITKLYKSLDFDNHLNNLGMIPKIHIQILFFLLFPNYFHNKLDKFFALKSTPEKELFFKIENWLMSSRPLPKATYYQIINKLVHDNILIQNKWKIGDHIINLELINVQIYQIIAENDMLVPGSSILPLQNSLKTSKIFRVRGGHISYLINNGINNLFKEYENE